MLPLLAALAVSAGCVGAYCSDTVSKGIIRGITKIPGVRYLTGADLARHKRNYEESRIRYNNYAHEAQTTINNLSGEIQQSMQGLRSLEGQQYHYSNRSYEMENQLNQYASQYDNNLKNIEAQRARLSSSAQQLKQSFESLKQKAPALEARMREVEQLPGVFQNLYDRVAQQKDSLRGLTEEEAGSAIAKHQQDVESLKKQRQAIEEKIRYSMNDITREHKNISMEKAELEHQLGNYQASQDRLLQDTSKFDQARYQLTSMIDQYKQQQNRAEQIETDYASRQSRIEGLQDKLRSYSGSAQSQLDSYAHDVKWRAGKYEKSAGITGLVQGGVLGALTFGATMGLAGLAGFGGLGAGIAAGTGSGLVGIGHYMNTSNIANKLGNLEKIDLANNHQYDGMSGNLDQMARYGRSGLEKMPIAELGGLKQAVEHFNMRSVPRLQDLPKLSESLGKIVSLKDIEGLTLGLPSMTAASGKKYNYEVLYDNEFIKKLKKVSKKLGEPYLNPNSTINPNTNTRNMVTAYG
ncbi:hypothetical protein [Candidatus Tisiphia endosymbiont of Hybos culiciformis]|uniref:hypothetical protein n=1 Tax=Candidatus Tisiphia endosymbiont of Hybos culiciformis TaxID=3139331 RepID=UPI003CCAC4FA